ncbi:MAG: D-2-hydroxyacid dehydrogenase [Thermomicrobiales bacterium]
MSAATGKVNLLIGTPLEPEWVEQIRATDARLNVIFRPDLLGRMRWRGDHHPSANRTPEQEAEFRALLGEAEVLFDFDADTSLHLPTLAPRLRWVQTSSAGVGQAAKRYGLDRTNVIITTTSGLHAVPLAEFVMMAVLMFTKRYFLLAELKERREFARFSSDALPGKNLALIGPGKIGREIARLARACGMTVDALGRTAHTAAELGVDRVRTRAELRPMLAAADFIVLAMPHTPETEDMIGAAEIAVMKPTAVLINIARGEVIDEAALAAALRDGRLAGAALDVFRQEPLPADSPFWTLPNVIINPHSASTADAENGLIADLFCENLRHYLAGHPERMRNILDKQLLY